MCMWVSKYLNKQFINFHFKVFFLSINHEKRLKNVHSKKSQCGKWIFFFSLVFQSSLQVSVDGKINPSGKYRKWCLIYYIQMMMIQDVLIEPAYTQWSMVKDFDNQKKNTVLRSMLIVPFFLSLDGSMDRFQREKEVKPIKSSIYKCHL